MRLKNVSFIAILFCFIGIQTANGQETETLFDGIESNGGFGAPMIKISNLGGEPGIWMGGRGAWLINLGEGRALSIGGGGFGLASPHNITPEVSIPENEYSADIGYGGFEAEYYLQSNRLIHYSFSAMIGGGGYEVEVDNLNNRDYTYDEDSFFIVEPGVNVELNVTTFFRISARASYMLTSGLNSTEFNDNDLSGLAGTLSFKFGQLQ